MGIQIYTDGGCSGNPGPGGWAYLIEDEEELIAEKWGAEANTTNNRMELSAVIAALDALSALGRAGEPVTVYTDSQYVQKGISLWIRGWKRNNWMTSSREPVKNRELWQRLDAMASTLAIRWQWVKGHAGNPMNERCDRMTQTAIQSMR